ncbi:MAG: thiol reductant ABC exporter subunit CydD [Eggerthellaceae bacterium]|nr:thiol reductant ABC exporter subunit CydD [Eggerthellaceae bacterium]
MIDRAIFSLPGVHRMLAIVAAFSLLRAAAVAGQALGLAYAIVGLWGGGAVADQFVWVALFLICFVARQLIVNLQSALLDRYAHQRADALRQELVEAVFALGPALVSRMGTASVSQTVIEGIEDVRTYISLIIPKIIVVVVVPFVLLAVIFPLDWVSGIIALVCYPFIILYMVMIGHTAQDEAAKRHGEFQRMANYFLDGVAGISELKAFGMSRRYESSVFAASERFRAMTMKTLRIATLSSTVLDLFATLALAGVAVMLGFRLVEGSIACLPALAVLIMVPEYFRPIREFAADYHASLDGRSAFAAIRVVLDGAKSVALSSNGGEGEPCDSQEPLGGEGDLPDSQELLQASLREDSSGPKLEFRGVGYSYPDREEALRNVSFAVEGPCKVGLIGTSGSGKSTLMSLLAGFSQPSVGQIIVNGLAVSSLASKPWRRAASFIPQDPYIFNVSLRDNIAFYKPSANDAEVARAASMAGLDELVAELDEGLDTQVGKGGEGARGLSGGQAHRVALARAFLCDDRPVLLFDEPTAHLDIETELELKERVLPLMEGKLVFFATHRLHWINQMDYVIELDCGGVSWQGSAQEWLDRHREEGRA